MDSLSEPLFIDIKTEPSITENPFDSIEKNLQNFKTQLTSSPSKGEADGVNFKLETPTKEKSLENALNCLQTNLVTLKSLLNDASNSLLNRPKLKNSNNGKLEEKALDGFPESDSKEKDNEIPLNKSYQLSKISKRKIDSISIDLDDLLEPVTKKQDIQITLVQEIDKTPEHRRKLRERKNSSPLNTELTKAHSNDNACNAATFEHLTNFLNRNASSKVFYCKLCNDYWDTSNIILHFEKKHGIPIPDSPMECPVKECDKKFPINGKYCLNLHVKTIHLKCVYCGVLPLTPDQFATHNLNCSKTIESKTVQMILDKFSIKPQLAKKSGKKQFGCSQMDKPFLENFSIRNTVKLQFYCKHCNCFIRELDNFKVHLRTAHLIKIGISPLMCPVNNCSAKFSISDKSLLTKHVKTDHLSYTIKCQSCSEVFATVAHKQAHRVICSKAKAKTPTKMAEKELKGMNGCSRKDVEFLKHFIFRNNSKYYYYCKLCNKFEISLELFEMHLRGFHQIEMPGQPLLCPVSSCKIKFRIDEKRKLQQHVKHHLGYYYKCRFCDELFILVSERTRHENKTCVNKSANESIEQHEDCMKNLRYQNNAIILFRQFLKMQPQIKSFACKLCNGEEIVLKDIFQHFHTNHNDANETCAIVCPVEDCKAAFKYSERFHLARHMKNIHLAITCSACDFAFLNPIQRIKHEAKIHGLPKIVLHDVRLKGEYHFFVNLV